MKYAGREKRLLRVVQASPEELLDILLVDGDQANASTMKQWFETNAGARLSNAADAVSAARMIGDHQWDLVVIDLVSPPDFELLKQIKSLDRWLSTLVITQNQSAELFQLAVECRVEGLMFKPTAKAQFMEQALRLAEEARKRRQREQKRVLAIGAHPDDVEIGCGGSLARHRAQGDVVSILTLSRGAAGGDINIRTREALRAADLLNAKVEFGDLTDAHISEGYETIELIESTVRKFRPTHVYTHALQDTHQDHRAVHTASLVAARQVSNVYCYQAPSSTVDFRPNMFVDISDFIEAKLRAIGSYESQVSRSAMLQDEFIVATARYWGRYAGHGLAEPMTVVRQCEGTMGLGIAAEASAAEVRPAA